MNEFETASLKYSSDLLLYISERVLIFRLISRIYECMLELNTDVVVVNRRLGKKFNGMI